jgi:hypothetical protein
MRGSLVQQADIETLRLVLAKLPQKEGEAVSIQAGQLPPEGVASARLHGSIEPVVFIKRLNDLDRLAPIPGETTADRQVEPQPAFVLAEDPHGLRRSLPS